MVVKSQTVCQNWVKGSCKKGDECPYSHVKAMEGVALQQYRGGGGGKGGKDESRGRKRGKGDKDRSRSQSPAADKGKTLCKYWCEGSCRAGRACDWKHGKGPASGPPDDKSLRRDPPKGKGKGQALLATGGTESEGEVKKSKKEKKAEKAAAADKAAAAEAKKIAKKEKKDAKAAAKKDKK